MPIVTQCTAPGCATLTVGPLCVEHDAPVTRVFIRGRPFTRKPAPYEWRFTSSNVAFAPNVRRASERAVAAAHRR
jgi:hypothetical protein